MLHLTLVFLGATEPEDIPRIVAATQTITALHAPIAVSTGASGGRVDDRHAGVAWLSLAAGRAELARLALDLDRQIGSSVYANMAPRPHLTVVRRVDQVLLEDLRAAAEAGVGAEWVVDRVVLFRSHTGPTGSRYEPLTEVPLTLSR